MEKKMAKLLIVYESRTGNTEAMAKAVYEGALSAGATVSLKKAADSTMDDLLDCDAVIFGSPTNFGYIAGTLKEFFDQVWLTQRKKEISKPYAVFGVGSMGGKPVLVSIDRICEAFSGRASFKFVKAHEGVETSREPSPDVLEQCKQLGKKMAQS